MNQRPLNSIEQADRAAYERDGIVCLRGMFDREWIAFEFPVVWRGT